MSEKTYVIRKKIIKIKPTPIPESTYKPEIMEFPKPQPPIPPCSPIFEQLSCPKVKPESEKSSPPLPRYRTSIPKYDPVDIRVNVTTIERDNYLQNAQLEQIKRENEDLEGAKDFIKWQSDMKQQDEEARTLIIQQRRADIDLSRKRINKIRKQNIENNLQVGNEVRSEIQEMIKQTQERIEEERNQIKELKSQLVDLAPIQVARVKREKREICKQMRKDFKRDIKTSRRKQREELAEKRKHVEKIQYEDENHTNRHGDIFIQKKDITETKFLAALTDEETNELIRTNHERQVASIEAKIAEHRKIKEEKQQRLYELLNEETRIRDQAEIEHKQKREEAKQKREEEAIKRQQEEDEKMLELEKKLEKKRKNRIKEAEEMEEHMREISARNRYLALNKRALEVKAFQSHQDARLRMAQERQNNKIQKPLKPSTPKKKKETELVRLKAILGV